MLALLFSPVRCFGFCTETLVCMLCLSFQVSDFRNVFFSLESSLVLLIGCNWLLPNAWQRMLYRTVLKVEALPAFTFSLELVTFVVRVISDCRGV